MSKVTNFTLTGKVVQFLGLDDKIRASDLIRDLVETGSEGGFNKDYKSDEWLGTHWHLVSDDFSGWIGKTYRDYLEFTSWGKTFDLDDEWSDSDMHHEIVRIIN